MASKAPPPKPSFDADGKLRVLDAVRSQQTEELEREARTIVAELQDFSSTVSSVVENLSAQAAVIEGEKHKAIGLRALAEAEKSARARRQRELAAAIDERAEELSRLSAELESLQRVEGEQRELIEKLSNNDAP